MTPKIDRTDLLPTEEILNHVLPDTDLPAQLTRHAPPVTLDTTDTRVPAGMTAREREFVEAVARSVALHSADVVVAPRTSFGSETAATANTRTAARSDVANVETSDECRAGRRMAWDNTNTSLA